MTGTDTASDMARVNARSYPARWPSVSMLVSRISPAPSSTTRRAHLTASRPVGVRPPWVETSQRESSPSDESPCQRDPLAAPGITRLASMATTMH